MKITKRRYGYSKVIIASIIVFFKYIYQVVLSFNVFEGLHSGHIKLLSHVLTKSKISCVLTWWRAAHNEKFEKSKEQRQLTANRIILHCQSWLSVGIASVVQSFCSPPTHWIELFYMIYIRVHAILVYFGACTSIFHRRQQDRDATQAHRNSFIGSMRVIG